MRKRTALSVLLTGLTLSGCAGQFHQVQFAGEVAPDSDVPESARTVHVVRNTEMRDTVAETRIRARLEAFLLERGYVIAPPETAELYVLATFGAGTRVVASSTSVHRPAEVRVQRGVDGNVVRRVYIPERMESWRVPTLQNSVWLLVLSSDAKYFRETGLVRNFWRGEAAMQGKANALGDALPYLLIPALKYFGRGTDHVVTMDVRKAEIAWHNVP